METPSNAPARALEFQQTASDNGRRASSPTSQKCANSVRQTSLSADGGNDATGGLET